MPDPKHKADKKYPRVSFGMIALNGEPFIRYNLRALYPFAHEIIVVEGAVEAAANIATPDGHSLDNTLAILQQFKAEEDPEDKVHIIIRDGFWEEKDAMSRAYADRATGDYLWQIDMDEFYMPEAMGAVIEMLREDPTITAVSFPTITFWGAPQYRVDSWFLRRGDYCFHRLFRWGEGYEYVTHRPPTVRDRDGHDQRTLNWLDCRAMARRGVYLYHYSLLLPQQVLSKNDYYGRAAWARRKGTSEWVAHNYMQLTRPFRVHNVDTHPGWLERFEGDHPPQIQAMWQAAQQGELDVMLRHTDDVERLLSSPWYRIQRAAVKYWDYADRLRLLLGKMRRQTLKMLKSGKHNS